MTGALLNNRVQIQPWASALLTPHGVMPERSVKATLGDMHKKGMDHHAKLLRIGAETLLVSSLGEIVGALLTIGCRCKPSIDGAQPPHEHIVGCPFHLGSSIAQSVSTYVRLPALVQRV